MMVCMLVDIITSLKGAMCFSEKIEAATFDEATKTE